jgi:hypothetical protein
MYYKITKSLSIDLNGPEKYYIMYGLLQLFSAYFIFRKKPVASHRQPLSHNVVHLTLIEIRTHNISGDRH